MKKLALCLTAVVALYPFSCIARRTTKHEKKPNLLKSIAHLAQADQPKELIELESSDVIQNDQSMDQDQIPSESKPEVTEETISRDLIIEEAPEQTPEPEEKPAMKEEGEPAKQEPAAPDTMQSMEKKKPEETPLTGASPKLTFDIEARRQAVIKLVEQAAQVLRDEKFDHACNLFSHTKQFINGELYMFVYDMKGTCLAHGEDSNLIWKNLLDLRDALGTPIVQQILTVARKGGGWVTYNWHNATKLSYIQQVTTKDNKTYAIGSGFYPQSTEETVVNLVKAGVALFNKIKEENNPVDWAFSTMSYPRGNFISGNLYLYALDFKGTIMAQGERPGLINSNVWDYRDSKGKYVNREIIEQLKTAVSGIWIEYSSKRALKKTYAEKVTDRKGNDYFIACGYYPEANREHVEELVRDGYTYMKANGRTAAVEEFNSLQSDRYRYGDLSIELYTMDGKLIAYGANPAQSGQNFMTEKDDDGNLYIKEMISRANKSGVWTNARIGGAFQSTFSVLIDLGIESFVLACSYYPISKPESMTLLAQSAANFLTTNDRETAFAQFVSTKGIFRRGDLQIFVIDEDGLCFAYGDDYDLIWRNILSLQDDEGRPFIKMFINSAKQGPNYVEIKLNHATKVVYVTPVEKDGKKYIVGSGYYL